MYLCAVANASLLFRVSGHNFSYILITIAIFVGLYYKIPLSNKLTVLSLLVFLINLIMLRLRWGGIGIAYFVDFATNAYLALVAYEIDREFAAKRFIKTVQFLSITSLIGYVLYYLAPNIIFSLSVNTISGISKPFYGLYLFVISSKGYDVNEIYRNSGIYTEPGLFMMLLIPALYLLLFSSAEKLKMDSKEYVRSVVIIIVALLSTFSSTAYISFMVLIIGLIFSQKNRIKNQYFSKILIFIAVVLGFIIGEYFINGSESILEKFLFGKVNSMGNYNSSNGNFNSGDARLVMMIVSLQSIINNPLGTGPTVFFEVLNGQGFSSAVGCGIFFYLAVLGIVGWGVVMNYVLRPAYRNAPSFRVFIVFAVLYIIANFSQNYIFAAPFLFVSLVDLKGEMSNESIMDV